MSKSGTTISSLRRWGLLGGLALLAVTACGSGSETAQRLVELGGEPCSESQFTCIVLTVPMDQFAPDDRTIEIPFAVLPATGQRQGVIVTLVGGPGGSGVDEAAWQSEAFSAEIRQRFDLVYFDQRGVGMYEDDVCPIADARYDETIGDDPSWEEEVSAWQVLLDECIAELGDPEVLAYLGTDQAIRDLETFRLAMGYDELILYGQSYGTRFAQAYATEFPASVERVVLDGPIDRTRDGIEGTLVEIDGLTRTLDLVFEACDVDPDCTADMELSAHDAYRSLHEMLAKESVIVQYPMEPDIWEERVFTVDDLSYLAHQSSYSKTLRILFLRALAAGTADDDWAPLIRLADAEWFDSSWLVHNAINCLDMSLPGESAESELQSVSEARDAAPPAGRWLFEFPARCANWPHVDHGRPPAAPFNAAEIPTLVIASTADPATPYLDGVSVTEQTEDGQLLTVNGGSHVMFGSDVACVNDAVSHFLLDGIFPNVVECSSPVLDPYQPLLDADLEDPARTIRSLVDEVRSYPELLTWDRADELVIACPHGGVISAFDTGRSISASLGSCGLTDYLEVFANVEFDYDRQVTYVDLLSITGTECSFRYRMEWETGDETVTERCD